MSDRASIRRWSVTISLAAIVCGVICLASAWLRSDDLFFWADEITVIDLPHSQSYWQIWTFLPKSVYGSRPLGLLFNKLLFDLFGWNYQAHLYGFVFIHALNTLLAYLIMARVLDSRLYAYAGCLLYAAWFPALATVFFVGAAFDLLSAFFMLLSIALFMRPGFSRTLLSVAAYYLSMRAKEAAITVPVILSIYLWSTVDFRWTWQAIWSIVKRCAGHYGILLIYLVAYARLSHIHPGSVDSSYRLEFTDAVFFHGLSYYVKTLCYSIAPTTLHGLCFALAVAASLFWRWKPGIVGGLGFVLSLHPVIFLAQHQEFALYLYGPYFFFVLMIGGAIQLIGNALQVRLRFPPLLVSVLVVVSALAYDWVGLRSNYTKSQIAFSIHARQPMARIHRLLRQELPSVPAGSRFYISGLPNDLMPAYRFYTEGAKLLRLMYSDPSIECEMEGADGKLYAQFEHQRGPAFFIDYRDGKATLDRRMREPPAASTPQH